MSSINEKLGFKPAGARARLNALSGVGCPRCPHHHVLSNVVHGRLLWTCGACAFAWTPTSDDLTAYNARVRDRDRIAG